MASNLTQNENRFLQWILRHDVVAVASSQPGDNGPELAKSILNKIHTNQLGGTFNWATIPNNSFIDEGTF